MNTIIAGRFDQQGQADRAAAALIEAGFAHGLTAKLFVNPPGQHDRSGTPGDPGASAGAHHAGAGAAAGAATGSGIGTVVGLATVPVLGPAGPLAGAAIGAYVGSLAGAVEQLHDPKGHAGHAFDSSAGRGEPLPRKSGMLVAVVTESSSDQASAIQILRAHGAVDVERAQGSITDSDWNDFDPLRPLTLVSA